MEYESYETKTEPEMHKCTSGNVKSINKSIVCLVFGY